MTTYAQGAYKAEIIAQGLGESSNKNPQFWFQVRVLECLDPATPPIEQYERTIYWSITEKTVEYVCEKLKRLGFAGDSFRQLDANETDGHSFVGQEVELYCKLETYDGREREKWDLSRGGGGLPNVAPLEATAARKLDAMFGKKLKETVRGNAPAKPAAAPKPKADTAALEQELVAANDDIPF